MKNLFIKGMVLVIIVLFFGMNFVPSVFGNNSYSLYTIIVPDDYPKIQDAINAANEGDTVFVRSGEYYENIVVDKSINLVGEDIENTIIDGSGIGNVVDIIVDDVYINEFQVRNGISGFHLFNSSGNIIENVDVNSNSMGGIYLEFESNDNLLSNCNVENNYLGIVLWNVSDNNIVACIVDSNFAGFVLVNSSNNELLNNIVSNNIFLPETPTNSLPGVGIIFGQSGNNFLTNNSFLDNTVALLYQNLYNFEELRSQFNNIIDTSNTVNGKPLYYFFDENNLVLDDIDTCHLSLAFCDNFVLSNCNVIDGDGIFLWSSNENIITDSVSSENYFGLYIHDGLGENTISECSFVENKGFGIFISTDNNSVLNCDIRDNYLGMVLEDAFNTTIRNNEFVNNGVFIQGNYSDRITNVIEDNTVNGKPLIYLENQQGYIIDSEPVGQLIVVNCSDFLINNIDILNTDIGITCIQSENVLVNNSKVSDSFHGMAFISSVNNSIENCEIYDNFFGGIQLWIYSNDTVISGCNIKNAHRGIILGGVSNGIIFDNIISDNEVGIVLFDSIENSIYHNNFIENNEHVVDDSLNIWDDGEYGNYWDDYEERYPDARKVLLKGIWDTSYEIYGGMEGSEDRYPLVKQWPNIASRSFFKFDYINNILGRFILIFMENNPWIVPLIINLLKFRLQIENCLGS